MSWRCKLLKRWLPEYPDGELPAFLRWPLGSHLANCSACRQELAACKEVVAAVQATPVKDPGQEFWDAFNRELHLKLAQLAQAVPTAPAPRRLKIPYYLLGAPALAVLVLWIAAHLSEPQKPVLTPPQVAQEAPQAPVVKEAPPVRVAGETSQEQILFAGMGNGVLQEEEELPDWDPDPVIADLNDQEREILLKKLKSQEKDGSCATVFSSVSWA